MWNRKNGTYRPEGAAALLLAAALAFTLLSITPSPLSGQSAMSADGVIESTSGGFMFPDGSVQESAVATALTPIDSVPFTVTEPGSYYLTRSMTIDTGTAITIDASNVTLNLMGHTLDGLSSAQRGIEGTASSRNVVIKNGTVVGFVTHALTAGTVFDSTGGYQVRRLRVIDNLGTGIVLLGPDAVVSGCEARGNGSVGIQVGDRGVVRDSISSDNLGGIIADSGARLTNNLTEGNQNNGMRCLDDCSAFDNTVRGNNTGNQTGFAGLRLNGDNSLARGNHVTGNLQQNILVSGSGNAIEGNLVTNSSIGVHFDNSAGDNATANNRWSGHTTADFQNNGFGTIAALDNLAF